MIRYTAMEVHYDKRRNTIQFYTHNRREILFVKLQSGLARRHGINIYTLYVILLRGKLQNFVNTFVECGMPKVNYCQCMGYSASRQALRTAH